MLTIHQLDWYTYLTNNRDHIKGIINNIVDILVINNNLAYGLKVSRNDWVAKGVLFIEVSSFQRVMINTHTYLLGHLANQDTLLVRTPH